MRLVFSLLICLPILLGAQESLVGGKYVTNFKGFEAGYTYPYLTLHKGTNFLAASHYNGGIKGGWTCGRLYKSGIAFSFSPSASYCYIGRTVFEKKFSQKQDVVTYRDFSFHLPGSIEFPFLFRWQIRGTAFLSMPVESSGSINSHETRVSLMAIFSKDRFRGPDPPWLRQGFLVQLLIPVLMKEDHRNYISLDFTYFANDNNQTSTRERWLSMTYVRRNLFIKEKREKWDSYLMKERTRYHNH
jgi:hypothetical protein